MPVAAKAAARGLRITERAFALGLQRRVVSVASILETQRRRQSTCGVDYLSSALQRRCEFIPKRLTSQNSRVAVSMSTIEKYLADRDEPLVEYQLCLNDEEVKMAKIVNFKDIPLEDLVIGTSQVRLSDVGKEIEELAESIAKVGLLEPILVAPLESGEKYEIILGQRRFLAHQRLGEKTIKAGILDDRVEEIQAKVLSVTENLVRRNLNRKDLIDVCTYLYKHYASVKEVSDETGLPYEKVRECVKYDRLIPELKVAVDRGEADLKAALRAQDALATEGDPDPQDSVKLAKEMSQMSGAQQENIRKKLRDDSEASVDELVERAKSGEKVTQIIVTLGQQIRNSLGQFAKDEGTNVGDAAAQLIESGLSRGGYDTDRGIA